MIWFLYAFLWIVIGLLAAIAFGRMCGSPIDHVQATVERLERVKPSEGRRPKIKDSIVPRLDADLITRKVAGLGRR